MADTYSVPHSASPDFDTVYPRGFTHTRAAVRDPIADTNLDADIGPLTSSAQPDTRSGGDGHVNTHSYPYTYSYTYIYDHTCTYTYTYTYTHAILP